MQPPTEPRVRTKMPLLPAEIILAVCGCFTVGPHNPAKGFHVSLFARDNIRALRQLSVTCRGIHDIVTPVLYGSIYFTGPKTDPHRPIPTERQDPGAENLVYFLRTILENAKLRQYVKNLACLMDLRDRCDFNEIMDAPDTDYDILSTIRDCKDTRAIRLLNMTDSCIRCNFGPRFGFEAAVGMTSHRPIASISHHLFSLVICLLPNLTSICLRIGSDLPHYPRLPDLYHCIVNDRTRQSGSEMARHSYLQKLRTLQVQCEATEPARSEGRPEICLLDMMPLLQIASNLTLCQGYGYVSDWCQLPETVTSFEGWGTVAFQPFTLHNLANGPIQHLKTMVIRQSSAARHFAIDLLVTNLVGFTPALEHLEILLSPGVRVVPAHVFPTFMFYGLSRLRHLGFDTRFFSEDHWDYFSAWYEQGDCSDVPPNIETLRIIDSEPRRNPKGILKWLDKGTFLGPAPGRVSRLKNVEYLHMPLLTDKSIKAGDWNLSELGNETKQRFAQDGVQFQLRLVKAEGGETSGAELMKQDHI